MNHATPKGWVRIMRTPSSFRRSAPAIVLTFPNPSRSYDATRRAVRFWGYHSAMEASFSVTEEALRRIQPDAQLDEAGLLRVFDANRALIYATAVEVYGRGPKGVYHLMASDF